MPMNLSVSWADCGRPRSDSPNSVVPANASVDWAGGGLLALTGWAREEGLGPFSNGTLLREECEAGAEFPSGESIREYVCKADNWTGVLEGACDCNSTSIVARVKKR